MLTTILCPSRADACLVSMVTLGILLSAAMNRCLVPFQKEKHIAHSNNFPPITSPNFSLSTHW